MEDVSGSMNREDLPRLLCALQSLNVDPNILTIIGVDQNLRSPMDEERQYDIKKVPTIIVFRNGAEFDRIVESTIGPLEKDMLGFFYAQAPSQPMPTGIDAGVLPPTPETPPSLKILTTHRRHLSRSLRRNR